VWVGLAQALQVLSAPDAGSPKFQLVVKGPVPVELFTNLNVAGLMHDDCESTELKLGMGVGLIVRMPAVTGPAVQPNPLLTVTLGV
jgi:hypothetical protein